MIKKKKSACQCRRHKRFGFDSWVGKIPWNRKRQSTPVFLPGKSHGQKSLASGSPWGCKESDAIKTQIYNSIAMDMDEHIDTEIKV